jgi:undecaprenyl-diphosphatase
MSIFQAIVLGIVQGATEFLPISSSGHLVIVPWILGWELEPKAAFVFDVLVQLGTLLAVIFYFRADLWAIARAMSLGLLHRRPFEHPLSRRGYLLVLASLPAGAAGLVFKPAVEQSFGSPPAAGLFLLVTSLILAASERLGKRLAGLDQLSTADALVIGLAQALSIFPGISRSGSTIAGGLIRNLTRPEAARFSFLMSIPIMLGAGAVAALDAAAIPNLAAFLPGLAAGFFAATLVGYLSIRWMLAYVARRPLTVFIAYCFASGLAVLLVGWARA